MAKHRLGKTLLGLAAIGAAAGSVIAYLMRSTKKQAEELEEEFQEFDNEEDTSECSRSYTTLPVGGKDGAESEAAQETKEIK